MKLKKRNRCVFILCSGKYFEKHYSYVSSYFEKFADINNADLHIQKSPIDPLMRHNIMTQRLLLPKILINYEHILTIDIDIHISKMENFFDDIISYKADCAAVPMPVFEPVFDSLCKNLWGVRNLYIDKVKTDIVEHFNGGVIYFNTAKTANLLENYYYSKEIYDDKNLPGFNN